MLYDIKLAILKSGRPQYEIAREVGISDSQLSKFLYGRARLRPELVRKLRILLGVEAESPDD